ncbi:hydrogenobyrinate a,c-diamide synthase [Roseibium aquae]|uniref:Hydrogenobyrinate a,c-diamide synthase n=1 Tax=Roseibium aquae TaxID=1323746 RepID=A0A916TKT1_9HYPH|nr:cobyrinate a,c-diamide synthase [Roseibium aquae]GGB48334.1 hydrogenobyrinate a,c-diamide synthase [Roseibium aquae]
MKHDPAKGLLIAAPGSGAGKTTVTLALLRALKASGQDVVSAKSGPDYIDPKFHEAATGKVCINLDAWAMGPGAIRCHAASHSAGRDLLLIEGAMGLFDGAATGRGSAADLATVLDVPVCLVVDCAKQAQSVAALVHGFASFRADVRIAGVILNRVGSARHEAMLRQALAPLGIPVLGALPRSVDLVLPERHLGLVQAFEHPDLQGFLDRAANICAGHIDLARLLELASPLAPCSPAGHAVLPPLGQRMAIARDVGFAFSYPHLVAGWQAAGAELSFFSPLADEGPCRDAEAIFLPGGYPELHAGRLAAARSFKAALRAAHEAGTLIYGECGGYMALGEGLVDATGARHEMLGLLPLETSFADRKRHLGYRVLEPLNGAPFSGPLSAHEFHYASILREGDAPRLFTAKDAENQPLGDMGLRVGNTMGSFAHVIAAYGPA